MPGTRQEAHSQLVEAVALAAMPLGSHFTVPSLPLALSQAWVVSEPEALRLNFLTWPPLHPHFLSLYVSTCLTSFSAFLVPSFVFPPSFPLCPCLFSRLFKKDFIYF